MAGRVPRAVDGADAVGDGDLGVARLDANGGLDSTFSCDGKLTLGYGASKGAGTAVAIQQNGRIVVMGNADPTMTSWSRG